MCGRFTISISNKELKEHLIEYYNIEDYENEFSLPRYNVAPGQNVITIINDGIKNRIGLLKWGFVPFFAKDEKIGFNMINAKSETLHQKPFFKESFKNKRCVILANGFYEWIKDEKNKIPVRIMLKNDEIFPLAGLWSSYTRNDGFKLYTCTIITTTANSLVSKIHDRMPVILTNQTKNIWLDPNITDLNFLSTLLLPYEADNMYAYKVSTLVNNPKNEVKECINSL